MSAVANHESLAGVASIMALFLAAVFATAGVVKLRSPGATGSDFAKLGVPAAGTMARIVPVVELSVAVTLVTRPAIGAAAAMVVLSAFTVVLIGVIASGRTVSCGCLGAMSRRPVSIVTVARNTLFLAMAAAAATNPSLQAPDLESAMTAGSLMLLSALLLQLLDMGQVLGRVWSVELAGEPGGRTSRGSL